MKFRQSLFWDTDVSKIDPQKHSKYIIERVLDLGRDDEVRWVWNNYDKKLIKEVVDNPRRLRPSTKALWNLVLN